MYATKRARAAAVTALSTIGIVLIGGGCEPCAFTACSRAPAIVVVGQLVDESTGRPVSGATIGMREASAPSSSEVTTQTALDGAFQVSLPSASVGSATLVVAVAAPGKRPYVVPDLPARATTSAGDATVLPPWSAARPVFPHVVIVNVNGVGTEGILVEFQRTGGRQLLNGGPVSAVQAHSVDQGYTFLLRGLTTDTSGAVIGDLTIHLPAPAQPLIIQGVSFTSQPQFNAQFSHFIVNAQSP
jgi:hypothetical protein